MIVSSCLKIPPKLRETNLTHSLQEVEDDLEEKAKLISQVLELQNTLEDLSSRVDNVKEENLRLRSENQVRLVSSQGLMIFLIVKC